VPLEAVAAVGLPAAPSHRRLIDRGARTQCTVLLMRLVVPVLSIAGSTFSAICPTWY
jgi:hypothetical protein